MLGEMSQNEIDIIEEPLREIYIVETDIRWSLYHHDCLGVIGEEAVAYLKGGKEVWLPWNPLRYRFCIISLQEHHANLNKILHVIGLLHRML